MSLLDSKKEEKKSHALKAEAGEGQEQQNPQEMNEQGLGRFQSEQAKIDSEFMIDHQKELDERMKLQKEVNKSVDLSQPKAAGMSATALKQGDLPHDANKNQQSLKSEDHSKKHSQEK